MKINKIKDQKKIQKPNLKGEIKITQVMIDQTRVKGTRMKIIKKPIDVFVVKKMNILKRIIGTKLKI